MEPGGVSGGQSYRAVVGCFRVHEAVFLLPGKEDRSQRCRAPRQEWRIDHEDVEHPSKRGG